MAQNHTGDRYMILSSDTHAGALTRTYKEFLDPVWHDDFDAWEAAITARIGPPAAEVHTPLAELPISKGLSFNTEPSLESVITR